jgi:hypothetical protein
MRGLWRFRAAPFRISVSMELAQKKERLGIEPRRLSEGGPQGTP